MTDIQKRLFELQDHAYGVLLCGVLADLGCVVFLGVVFGVFVFWGVWVGGWCGGGGVGCSVFLGWGWLLCWSFF